ncbi:MULTISPECIES: energy-coupling factor transporter transmembrane component T family protein [unclassified Luteococcus]|uniref:energy-coupling factor transporter transmembrane component T family protein n=1 Tax=unclassified Luteococcus TaxID=2639923 RepID=UPI00313AD9AE
MSRRGNRNLLDRVNPATRLGLAIILSIPLIITLDWVSASVALALEALALVLCGVSPVRILRRLLPLVVIAPLGAVSMLLYGQAGGRTWWRWGPVHVSDNSILLAISLFIRIFALALPAIMLLAEIDATRMADGLSQVIRLPAHFVLGSLAGFRMLALFTEDWRTLGQARRARGLGDGGRLRRWALMSFSLLVLALRRGGRLATAMEAKGFGAPVERTWARESTVGWPDLIAVLACLGIAVASVAAAIHCGTLLTVLS